MEVAELEVLMPLPFTPPLPLGTRAIRAPLLVGKLHPRRGRRPAYGSSRPALFLRTHAPAVHLFTVLPPVSLTTSFGAFLLARIPRLTCLPFILLSIFGRASARVTRPLPWLGGRPLLLWRGMVLIFRCCGARFRRGIPLGRRVEVGVWALLRRSGYWAGVWGGGFLRRMQAGLQ